MAAALYFQPQEATLRSHVGQSCPKTPGKERETARASATTKSHAARASALLPYVPVGQFERFCWTLTSRSPQEGLAVNHAGNEGYLPTKVLVLTRRLSLRHSILTR